ncbi:MAG: hypothetical protein ACYS9X_19585 [Planctomycetota bacterium]|jgi:hypothetical protein
MRYSYAWEVGVEELQDWMSDGAQGRLPDRLYVTFLGVPVERDLQKAVQQGHVCYEDPSRCGIPMRTAISVVDPRKGEPFERDDVIKMGFGFPSRGVEPQWIVGRVHCFYTLSHDGGIVGFSIPRVETPVSRFTGESIAGLVVGAMGMFIFGLYLRRWLLGRKAHGKAAANVGA